MIRIGFIVLAMMSSALAQPTPLPDAATMQKALNVLKMQRESAMDAAAQEMIKNAALSEENAKLRAEMDALKKSSEGK